MEATMYHSDTICAIATSLNSSGIGIIRVSGEESISIIDSIINIIKIRNEFIWIIVVFIFILG